jgi:3-oxoacyl-[acyl-carrier protein] reductase
MTDEGPTFPDLIVVYGSETRLLAGLFERPCRFIRIYNRTTPAPRINCRDIAGIDDLDAALAAERAQAGGGALKIAFVGAAFRTQTKLFLAETLEDIELAVEVNILTYLRLVKTLLPHMVEARYGVFVYLSSFRATTTAKGVSVYAASKAFGERFFEVIGKEYGRLNICAVSIRMGYFDGRMTDIFDEDQVRNIARTISKQRFGGAGDLIPAIEFAISNPYLTSGVIDLTGGINFD